MTTKRRRASFIDLEQRPSRDVDAEFWPPEPSNDAEAFMRAANVTPNVVEAVGKGKAAHDLVTALRTSVGGYMADAERPVAFYPTFARIAGSLGGGAVLGTLVSATDQAIERPRAWEELQRTGEAPTIVSPFESVAWRLGCSPEELHATLTDLSRRRLVRFSLTGGKGEVRSLRMSITPKTVQRLLNYSPNVTIAP